jgi:hypothetical protein
MNQEHISVLQRIGQVLHLQHDDKLTEPLPERWIDLILYLDEKEKQQAKAPEPVAQSFPKK